MLESEELNLSREFRRWLTTYLQSFSSHFPVFQECRRGEVSKGSEWRRFFELGLALAQRVEREGCLSRNEDLDDTSNSSLPFLFTSFILADVCSGMRDDGDVDGGNIHRTLLEWRQRGVLYLKYFVQQLRNLEAFPSSSFDEWEASVSQLDDVLEDQQKSGEAEESSSAAASRRPPLLPPRPSREEAIARRTRQKALEATFAYHFAKLSRRCNSNSPGEAASEATECAAALCPDLSNFSDAGESVADYEESYRAVIRHLLALLLECSAQMARMLAEEMVMLQFGARQQSCDFHTRFAGGDDGRDSQRRRQPAALPAGFPPSGILHFRDAADVRNWYRAAVFGPSHQLPTVSLAECAELEMDVEVRGGLQQETTSRPSKNMKIWEDGPKRKIVQDQSASSDSDEDDAGKVDEKEIKDRSWDDWKEDNPRGIGNKMSNVG